MKRSYRLVLATVTIVMVVVSILVTAAYAHGGDSSLQRSKRSSMWDYPSSKDPYGWNRGYGMMRHGMMGGGNWQQGTYHWGQGNGDDLHGCPMMGGPMMGGGSWSDVESIEISGTVAELQWNHIELEVEGGYLRVQGPWWFWRSIQIQKGDRARVKGVLIDMPYRHGGEEVIIPYEITVEGITYGDASLGIPVWMQ